MRRLVTSRLICIYTICRSVTDLDLLTPFAIMDVSKFCERIKGPDCPWLPMAAKFWNYTSFDSYWTRAAFRNSERYRKHLFTNFCTFWTTIVNPFHVTSRDVMLNRANSIFMPFFYSREKIIPNATLFFIFIFLKQSNMRRHYSHWPSFWLRQKTDDRSGTLLPSAENCRNWTESLQTFANVRERTAFLAAA